MQDSESNQPAAAHDPVVADELALLERVKGAIAEGSTRAAPSESAVVRELERLREQMLASHDPTDRAALSDQWNRQSSLLRQLQSARHSPQVRLDCPYFAHLRLRENGSECDICLGKATLIQRGVRIVDWRNAPISRIFYRYQQGDEYEEEIAGRTVTGRSRRGARSTIRDGALQPRRCAGRHLRRRSRHAPGGWERAGASRRGWPAAKAPRCGPTRPRRGSTAASAPISHGRPAARRQAPARHRRADRSGAVRA